MENTSTNPDGNINGTAHNKPGKRIPRWLKITTGVLLAVYIISTFLPDPEKPAVQPASAANIPKSVSSTTPIDPAGPLTVDQAKKILENSDFHCEFKQAKEGTEFGSLRWQSGCSSIDISYHVKDRSFDQVGMWYNVTNLHPKISEVEPVFVFLEAFNKDAAAYYRKHFNELMKSRESADKVDLFTDDKKLAYSFDHSLFTAREVKKKDPKYMFTDGSLYIDVQIRAARPAVSIPTDLTEEEKKSGWEMRPEKKKGQK